LTTDTKMLASTMQFSSYGREPPPHPAPTHHTHPVRTPGRHDGRFDRGSGPQKKHHTPHEERPFPQDPTACQAGPAPQRVPPRPEGKAHPKANHRSTDAGTCEHRPTSRRSTLEQPPRNTRPGSGPEPTNPGKPRRDNPDRTPNRTGEPACSLERR